MATLATMSGAQFDALPYEEGRLWELLDGDLIAVPSATLKHQRVVCRLSASFETYLTSHKNGVTVPDVEFALGEDKRLRPDISIIQPDRWATFDQNRIPVQGAPNIAIEVISPSERTSESLRKVRAYLGAGVQEVWQIFPDIQEVIVYTTDQMARVLSGDDRLTTDLLPDWGMSCREITEP